MSDRDTMRETLRLMIFRRGNSLAKPDADSCAKARQHDGSPEDQHESQNLGGSKSWAVPVDEY